MNCLVQIILQQMVAMETLHQTPIDIHFGLKIFINIAKYL